MKLKLNGVHIFLGSLRNPDSMSDKKLCDYSDFGSTFNVRTDNVKNVFRQ